MPKDYNSYQLLITTVIVDVCGIVISASSCVAKFKNMNELEKAKLALERDDNINKIHGNVRRHSTKLYAGA